MIKVRVFAGNEDITEGKGVEIPWRGIREIVAMGLRVEVMKGDDNYAH